MPKVDYRLYSQYIGETPDIVPEFVLRKVIEPIFLPRAYQEFYNDKNMYDKLLPKSYLAKSLFRCIDYICCGEDYEVFYDNIDVKLAQMVQDYEKIIVKPTRNTGNGNSILIFKQDSSHVFQPLGHNTPFQLKILQECFKGNFVIQEYMKQSEFTASFNETSVNTFRIFTYKSVKTNKVHVLGTAFRIGKNNTFVDNCHAGGKYIGINPDGSFANPCVFDSNGCQYTTFNGIDFSKANFRVPNYDKIVEFAKSVAERIFHNRTLDLDVMIDKDGSPKLIEYNVDMCSPWFYQFSIGPLYGEFTDEVIEYIKKKRNN